MVFRIKDGKLYKINLNGISEDEFLKAQEGGKIKFIKLDYKDLPALPKTEKRVFNEVFYKLDEDEKIVIDEKRIEQKWIKDKYKEIENYIYSYYPQAKQQSDVADKNYYEVLLKNEGITDLEKDITAKTKNYFENGRNLDDVVNDVIDEIKEAYLQLVKTAIRVTWVIDCKKELKQAINEKREPEYPEFYL